MRLLFFALVFSACVPKAEYQSLQEQYDQAVAENTRLKEVIERQEAQGRAMVAEYKNLAADLQPLIDRGVVSLEVVDGRVVIGLKSDVLFASGSSDLSTDGRATVAEVAKVLTRRATTHDFQVEGHTDNEPISTATYPNNWYLGSARALSVTAVMIESGFPADHVSAASYSFYRPIESNDTADGRAANRRIEIVFVPDISETPVAKALNSASSRPPRQRRK